MEKCKMESNECISFSRCTSWSATTSKYEAKERERSQPVRITQLLNSKTIHCTVRKRAQPEKLMKAVLIESKAGSTQNNNVGDKSQQKKSIKKHLHNENTPLYSKSNRKYTTSHSNERDRKVRRNLNFNVVSPKQRIEEYTSMTCPSVQEEKKSICSNSSISRNQKSFLLPPNSIKKMYLEQRYSETKSLSTISSENDNTIRHLDTLGTSENLCIRKHNIQNCSFIEKTYCKSQTSVNLNSQKLIQYNCKSEKVKENTILIDNKLQEEKHHSACENKSSMSTNADNLNDICHELKNKNLTVKSEISANGNIADFLGEDRLSIDKDTIVSLKHYLEDLLNVFQDNACKVDSLLIHIKKILHAGTNSKEEHVQFGDSSGEIITKNLKTNQEQNVEENKMNTLISISVEDNNNVGKKIEVKSNEEKKENETPQKVELKLDHINNVKSLEFTPKTLQITTPNYTQCNESALQNYINLKSCISFLETPDIKKLRPHMPKNKNALSITSNNKSYLSTRILTELENLYDE
ncbi:hypothetical protein KPH14_011192 [Odynerus spinipes]|uniref:Uncharacterized protein n=1 Tax=Odynerus spinipes TaxID=1348599 RepID=A0AAD9VI14_9HYME|nr:hypothetical protein KPH14_011192 [Odynerus spinipes]